MFSTIVLTIALATMPPQAPMCGRLEAMAGGFVLDYRSGLDISVLMDALPEIARTNEVEVQTAANVLALVWNHGESLTGDEIGRLVRQWCLGRYGI